MKNNRTLQERIEWYKDRINNNPHNTNRMRMNNNLGVIEDIIKDEELSTAQTIEIFKMAAEAL